MPRCASSLAAIGDRKPDAHATTTGPVVVEPVRGGRHVGHEHVLACLEVPGVPLGALTNVEDALGMRPGCQAGQVASRLVG